mmetsp:Transcript_53532/g.88961  ORF Transcript_53532/g.88961 Transcript_53532/m.88961 type:complete len:98 (-) Transcript_53532:166-459(-)
MNARYTKVKNSQKKGVLWCWLEIKHIPTPRRLIRKADHTGKSLAYVLGIFATTAHTVHYISQIPKEEVVEKGSHPKQEEMKCWERMKDKTEEERESE